MLPCADSLGSDAQWTEGSELQTWRVSPQAVSAADDTDTGSVDFSGHQDATVPSASAGAGGAPTLSIDTSRFALFTDYTGAVTVTEDGSYLGGTDAFAGPPVPIPGHGSHESTAPYASYAVDNGFEEDAGALDTNIGGVDGSTNRTSLPEDDLGLASKTTVLTFDVALLSKSASLGGMQTAVEDDLAALRTMAAELGGAANLIATRKAYDAALTDTLTAGLGSLVDADMDVASTRLQALQVKQQLGLQALSITNADGALVLELFQRAP